MPARRDLHTGRLNFMHRSWGPLEPFDNSFPRGDARRGDPHASRHRSPALLRGRRRDVPRSLPHLGFHPRPGIRPVEGDGRSRRSNACARNTRRSITTSTTRTGSAPARDQQRVHAGGGGSSAAALLRIRRSNSSTSIARADQWFLMLECFDPHEPFQAPAALQGAVPRPAWNGGVLDWPMYEKVDRQRPRRSPRSARNYAALVAACDHYFGQLLDYFDRHDLWKRHGAGPVDRPRLPARRARLVGQEPDAVLHRDLAHPADRPSSRITRARPAQRRSALTQTMDLMPTFLDLVRLARTARGARPRRCCRCSSDDHAQRDIGIFGMFGGPIGATDGRYTYYLYPDDLYAPGLHEYTLMPMHLSLAVQRRRDEDRRRWRRRSTSPRACRSCASMR